MAEVVLSRLQPCHTTAALYCSGFDRPQLQLYADSVVLRVPMLETPGVDDSDIGNSLRTDAALRSREVVLLLSCSGLDT